MQVPCLLLEILRDDTQSPVNVRTYEGGRCQQGTQLSWRQPAAGARRLCSVHSQQPLAAACIPWH